MRLAMADLKKSVVRRDGEQLVTPYLLRPRERRAELDALIALYEAWLGRERASFPDDRPAELIGDFRLARCLTLCLGEWYVWASPVWPGPASASEAAALAEQGLANPGQLRLALYDAVNQRAGGYLVVAERDAWLDEFAAACAPGGLARATLDALLTLDADAQATLHRAPDVERAPTAAELAARYNQRAVETMLANASAVEWLIPPTVAAGSGGGLGAVVKRICFLARQMGVQYDVAFEAAPTLATPDGAAGPPPVRGRGMMQSVGEVVYGRGRLGKANEDEQADSLAWVAERPALYVVGAASDESIRARGTRAADATMEGTAARDSVGGQSGFAAPTTLEQTQAAVVVTLYGPQEVMGAPNQYGERLARLCRALLGYRRALSPQGAALGGGDGLRGMARVYLYGRPMTFPLDDRLLRLLHVGAAEATVDELANGPEAMTPDSATVAFDSSLERRLYADFTALERAGETAGWRMEREPEPLLIGATILVPDFALTRGLRRVYLEIAGYWRPGYRERKARKLVALRGAAALVVAAPVSSRAEFAGLDDAFPFLWYRDNGTINAALLISLIERAYDDFAARLAELDLPRIRAEVALRGRIPPTESMALLHCYTRDELAATTRRLLATGANETAGIGGGDDMGSTGSADDADDTNNQTHDVAWIDGVGLCSHPWRDAVSARLLASLRAAPDGQLALADLRDALNASPDASPAPAIDTSITSITSITNVTGAGAFTDEATEALARVAGAQVSRASLFAVMVRLPDADTTEPGAPASVADNAAPATHGKSATATPALTDATQRPAGRRAQPRRGVGRKEHDVPSVTPASSAFTQQTFFPPAPADAADPASPNETD